MFQNFKQAPDLLIGWLNDEDQAVVRERYMRMRSMVEDINQGQEPQWNLRDLKLPTDTVFFEKRKATFIWAFLYNLVFHSKQTAIGIVLFPVALILSLIECANTVLIWIGGIYG